MRSVLLVSPRRPARLLFTHFLGSWGCDATSVVDGDEAFALLKEQSPAVVLVDLRGGDEDTRLFLGLLRRRYPALPTLTLLPGKLRILDGEAERVVSFDASPDEELKSLLAALHSAVEDVLAVHVLTAWSPVPAKA